MELLFLRVTIFSDFYWYSFCFLAMWASSDSSCEIRFDDSLDYLLDSRSKELLISSALPLMLSVIVLANNQLLLAAYSQLSVLYLLVWPLWSEFLRTECWLCSNFQSSALWMFCLIFLTRYSCTECQHLVSSMVSFLIFLRILSSAFQIQRSFSFCLMAAFLKSRCFISLAHDSSSKLTSCACNLIIVRFSFALALFSTFALRLYSRSTSLLYSFSMDSDGWGAWAWLSCLAFQQNLSIAMIILMR